LNDRNEKPDIAALDWHLDQPFWSSEKNKEMLFRGRVTIDIRTEFYQPSDMIPFFNL
jgi:hypothetical protein